MRDTGLMRNPRRCDAVPVAQVPDGVTALNVKLLPLVWAVRTSGRSPQHCGRCRRSAPDRKRWTADIAGEIDGQVASESTARSRFEMLLMAVFAGAALLLSAIGVCGLMAYAVQQHAARSASGWLSERTEVRCGTW